MFSTLFGVAKNATNAKANVDPALYMNILQEVLECPVCYNIPEEPPVYQCENGHLVSISITHFHRGSSRKLDHFMIEI